MSETFKVRGHQIPLPDGMSEEELNVARGMLDQFVDDLDAQALAELRSKFPECERLPDRILIAAAGGDATAKAAMQHVVDRAHAPPATGLLTPTEEPND